MSSRLQSSASYKAYIELDGLPLGSVEWAKDDDENYIIPLGEIKCHILVGDELCGKTYKSRGALKTHVTKDHRKNAASAQATGNPSNQQQEAAQIMYSAIMKKHINLFPTASEPVPNPSVPNTPKSNNPASNGTTSEHNGNKSGRASKRNSGGGTSSQDDINKFGKAPNGKPKMKLPEYKKANKKVGIKKGDRVREVSQRV
ncbi:hypothetical protein BU23DRAFT_100903 [Bimuria novae-zelandiae CBS 107.79]|uniref:Uncharacterized protein n=1 Tax=Bimuria novae-zelandiae CBS 107.79 TaxID=1447943 RepID=A0A6A5W2A6_9PLEO|nr:hypothetical protein BU23DRAFT_100903 [Bimuria novae-zelandiae CBS 107.79]